VRSAKSILFIAAASVVFATAAVAQTDSITARTATVYVPGLMTGPGSFGPIGFRRLCDLRIVGLVEWRVRFIERTLRPNATQRAALGELFLASSKGRRAVAAACPPVRPSTSVEELVLMDKRLTAVAQAFAAIKPAFEAFYATLDVRQKAQIDGLGPHRRGWRW
jgi:hypothetical protein